MSWRFDDTISAVASAPGGAMQGVIRLSGPDVVSCLEHVFEADNGVRLRDIHRPTVLDGQLSLQGSHARLNCSLYLWPSARSYTRQPSAELHTLGSPPLLEAALRSVCTAGARLAEPGEFTLRAFLSGRLDLTQAEAVLGVIDAETQRELDVALQQLAGSLSGPLHTLRESLLQLLAHLEAGLDFVEAEIEFVSPAHLQLQLQKATDEIEAIASQMIERGETAGAMRVVLAGSPNVGKSSLMNALVGQPTALVSDTPGTTRDYLMLQIDLDGMCCELIDTAGVWDAHGASPVEVAAQDMTAWQFQTAQLELFCIDATRPLNPWERTTLDQEVKGHRMLVLTKIDAARATDLAHPAMETSSVTRAGIDQLRRAIRQRLVSASHAEAGVVAVTSVRCRESLRLAAGFLQQAAQTVNKSGGDELVALEIRSALDEIGKVVGAVFTDDVLERIFSRFCIGK